MIEELRTHYQMRDAVTITGIDLGHLLNMLIELRWMIEAAELAKEQEQELLRVIELFGKTLLRNEGQISGVQRDTFLTTVRAQNGIVKVELVDRIAKLLKS